MIVIQEPQHRRRRHPHHPVTLLTLRQLVPVYRSLLRHAAIGVYRKEEEEEDALFRVVSVSSSSMGGKRRGNKQ